jgi:hypothetical protein
LSAAFGVKTKREAVQFNSHFDAHGARNTSRGKNGATARAGQGTREARPAQGIAIKYLYLYLHFKSAVELAPVFRHRPAQSSPARYHSPCVTRASEVFVVVDYKSFPLARLSHARACTTFASGSMGEYGEILSFERRARESIRTESSSDKSYPGVPHAMGIFRDIFLRHFRTDFSSQERDAFPNAANRSLRIGISFYE